MEDKLMVSIGKDVVPIEIDSIIYVESRNRKVAIHTAKEEIEYYDKIEDLEQMLGDGFFRVHRGFLVNYNCEITLMCKDTSKCIISTVGKIVDIIKKGKLFLSETKEQLTRLDLTGERCSSERQRNCNDNTENIAGYYFNLNTEYV